MRIFYIYVRFIYDVHVFHSLSCLLCGCLLKTFSRHGGKVCPPCFFSFVMSFYIKNSFSFHLVWLCFPSLRTSRIRRPDFVCNLFFFQFSSFLFVYLFISISAQVCPFCRLSSERLVRRRKEINYLKKKCNVKRMNLKEENNY